jgi:dienelactone hydrolase
MIITHFRPPGAGRFPLIVISHGRSASAVERATPDRYRTLPVVRYWVARGFAVIVPTRLGYGSTGTLPDTEASGRTCNDRNYGPMADAAAHQIKTAVDFGRKLPFVDGTRVFLKGVSVGGLATTVAAGKDIPGLIAAINVAGGSGGNPNERPSQPCAPDRLSNVFAAAGKAAKVPVLWLYAENDKYWGAAIPRQWHRAFAAAGGKGDFVMLPPVGEDGHGLLRERPAWRPVVDRFLVSFGVAPPRTAGAPPATGFADIKDVSRVPRLRPATRDEHYPRFLEGDLPRAFVLGPKGEYAYRMGRADALSSALEACKGYAKTNCKPYAVDNDVVWKE